MNSVAPILDEGQYDRVGGMHTSAVRPSDVRAPAVEVPFAVVVAQNGARFFGDCTDFGDYEDFDLDPLAVDHGPWTVGLDRGP